MGGKALGKYIGSFSKLWCLNVYFETAMKFGFSDCPKQVDPMVVEGWLNHFFNSVSLFFHVRMIYQYSVGNCGDSSAEQKIKILIYRWTKQSQF